MKDWLEARWYRAGPPPLALRPLAALYGWVADRRRARTHPQRLDAPVIVVGNLSIGGTGKTPVTQWLVAALQARGHRPAILSRGYGGRGSDRPLRVEPDSDPAVVGDEPLLLRRLAGVPVWVFPDRVEAGRAALAAGDADVLVADDGLQHYRLHRDFELCVIDGGRGLGNGARLPAGPLREAPSRLQEVDLLLVNGGAWTPPPEVQTPWARFSLQLDAPRPLAGAAAEGWEAWRGRRVRAMAGIGHPQRFFDDLRRQGLILESVRAYPDHHAYRAADLPVAVADCPLLMTSKDAVKCARFGREDLYEVPATVALSPAVLAPLWAQLDGRS